MRWWLGLAFAVIAALTATLVAEGLTKRSESAFRDDAEARAIANSTAAERALRTAVVRGNVAQALEAVSERRRLALFLFDSSGRPVTPSRDAQTEIGSIPRAEAAVRVALDGRRYVRSYDQGRVTVVALPLPWDSAAALLTYSLEPGYGSTMTVIRDQILPTLTLAIVLGGLAGLLIASLVTRRLRRIGRAARAIESGDFGHRLEPRFHDEVGLLAAMFDRMRMRLQGSFERLQSERLRLRLTLERLDQGVVTLDEELKVESANDAAERLLVHPLQEGSSLPEPWPDFPLRSFARRLFAEGAEVERARISPGEGLFYVVSGIPAGDLPTAVLVIADVSEIERREQVEREFVANAAHELRTPVAAISSAVEVLEAGAKDRLPERDHFIAIIARQSARLARLSRSLLVLARAQTGEESVQTVAVDLCPLLEGIAAALQTTDEVRVEVDCPAGLMILAEPDLVEQVFSNLAANAARHTRRGRIGITARSRGDDKVEIELVDTGDGIPSAVQTRIFDRFYRGGTHEANGFGLGLAIVRQAVRVLDGTIELDSKVDAGTTVRVTLPSAKAA